MRDEVFEVLRKPRGRMGDPRDYEDVVCRGTKVEERVWDPGGMICVDYRDALCVLCNLRAIMISLPVLTHGGSLTRKSPLNGELARKTTCTPLIDCLRFMNRSELMSDGILWIGV
jgi:hypothetical protein